MTPEKLQTLRAANAARVHFHKACEDWNKAQWVQALIGELGEYANLRKKFDRGDMPWQDYRPQAAKELADTATYLDILALQHRVEFLPLDDIGDKLPHVNWDAEPPEMLGYFIMHLGCYQQHELLGGEDYSPGITQHHLSAMLSILQILAEDQNIDLWKAIFLKFNEVSRRIGAPIFLDSKLPAGHYIDTRVEYEY